MLTVVLGYGRHDSAASGPGNGLQAKTLTNKNKTENLRKERETAVARLPWERGETGSWDTFEKRQKKNQSRN